MHSTPQSPSVGPSDDHHTALAALGSRLDDIVDRAGPGSWTAETPAQGWDVRMQIAHLTWTDEVSLAAIADPGMFAVAVEQATADPTGFVDAGAEEVAAADRDAILDRWRTSRHEVGRALATADPGEKIPWFGPPMRPKSMATARIMETWAHGTDVADAIGVAVDDDPAFVSALPHVARIGYRTRGFAYTMNDLEPPTVEVRVALTAPDGRLHYFGPEDAPQSVTGSLRDFCLLTTQRIHRADTDLVATGEDAEHWLQIAQAFAGLPGGGREEGARG